MSRGRFLAKETLDLAGASRDIASRKGRRKRDALMRLGQRQRNRPPIQAYQQPLLYQVIQKPRRFREASWPSRVRDRVSCCSEGALVGGQERGALQPGQDGCLLPIAAVFDNQTV